jgi:hypothetical protein
MVEFMVAIPVVMIWLVRADRSAAFDVTVDAAAVPAFEIPWIPAEDILVSRLETLESAETDPWMTPLTAWVLKELLLAKLELFKALMAEPVTWVSMLTTIDAGAA